MECKTYDEYNDLGILTNHYSKIKGTNKLHGPFIINRRNGNKLCNTTYNQGLLDGLYQEWYDNGQLYIIATYKSGIFIKGEVFDFTGKEITTVPFNESLLAVSDLFIETLSLK